MSGDPGPGDPAAVGFRRSPTALLTLSLVALVLVIVVVLVIVKLTGPATTPPPNTGPPPQTLQANVAAEVTGVPTAVFDAVGVSSPTAPVTRPRPLDGQPALRNGGRPEVLYVGSEFCAYCAAERWSLAIALSRFGTLSGLGTMQSSGNAVFSGVQTFTFATVTYKSRYVAFVAKERYSDQQNTNGTGFAPFQHLDRSESNLLARYDVPARTGQPRGAMPFVDVGNRYVSAGSTFSPSVLTGLTRTKVASGLTYPKDPVTQAIVAGANYLSAAICSSDGERPASVCSGSAVADAGGGQVGEDLQSAGG